MDKQIAQHYSHKIFNKGMVDYQQKTQVSYITIGIYLVNNPIVDFFINLNTTNIYAHLCLKNSVVPHRVEYHMKNVVFYRLGMPKKMLLYLLHSLLHYLIPSVRD